MEEALIYATRLLGRIIQPYRLSRLGPEREPVLERVEFLRMGHSTVLILLVLKGGLIHHKISTLPCDMTQEALDELSRRVSTVAVGRSWGEVRGVLQVYVEDALERYAESCRSALREMDGLLLEQPFQFFAGAPAMSWDSPISTISAGRPSWPSSKGTVHRCWSAAVDRKGPRVTIGDENPELKMLTVPS